MSPKRLAMNSSAVLGMDMSSWTSATLVGLAYGKVLFLPKPPKPQPLKPPDPPVPPDPPPLPPARLSTSGFYRSKASSLIFSTVVKFGEKWSMLCSGDVGLVVCLVDRTPSALLCRPSSQIYMLPELKPCLSSEFPRTPLTGIVNGIFWNDLSLIRLCLWLGLCLRSLKVQSSPLPHYEDIEPSICLPLPLYEDVTMVVSVTLPRVEVHLPLYEGFIPVIRVLSDSHCPSISVMEIVCLLFPLALCDFEWFLWNLRKAQNQLLFKDCRTSADEVMLRPLKEARAWQEAQVCVDQTRPIIVPRALSLPPQAVLCFSDASWIAATRECGLGWCFKDVSLRIINQASISRSNVASALVGEALTLKAALIATRTAGIRILNVFSDSLSLVTLVNTNSVINELKSIFYDIHCLRKGFTTIIFAFISRLENVLADVLAKVCIVSLDDCS